MVQAPSRTAPCAPALIRLLARVAGADVAEPAQSLSDRLSGWFGWTDALALSAALNGAPPGGKCDAGRGGAPDHDAARECARVRTALAAAIAGERRDAGRHARDIRHARHAREARAARDTRGAALPDDGEADYALFRQHYLAMQQAMETQIAALRSRLRAALAARDPGLARLALLDAALERTLGERERNLLAGVPALLAAHFEHLRETGRQPADDAAPPLAAAWLDVFRQDMQSVLLAELEVRFQPVEGLLAALRTR
jgi:hypothetical protein